MIPLPDILVTLYAHTYPENIVEYIVNGGTNTLEVFPLHEKILNVDPVPVAPPYISKLLQHSGETVFVGVLVLVCVLVGVFVVVFDGVNDGV
jgi:hypothetical protein